MRPDYEVEQKGDQQSRSADSKHVNDKSVAPELAVLVHSTAVQSAMSVQLIFILYFPAEILAWGSLLVTTDEGLLADGNRETAERQTDCHFVELVCCATLHNSDKSGRERGGKNGNGMQLSRGWC